MSQGMGPAPTLKAHTYTGTHVNAASAVYVYVPKPGMRTMPAGVGTTSLMGSMVYRFSKISVWT